MRYDNALVFNVRDDQVLYEAVKRKTADIKVAIKDAGKGERLHATEEGDDISFNGMGAEACVINLYCREALESWQDDVGDDGNYGNDIKVEWLDGRLDKPVEVKFTRHFAMDEKREKGILFMRCKSGDAIRGQVLSPEYWEDNLPDSYYILLHQTERTKRPLKFWVVGFATRQMFLDHFETNQKRLNKLNSSAPGWPAICLWHWDLKPMDEFPLEPVGLLDGCYAASR